ncbi:MAG: transcription antitermination factor NusB [Candidatus Aminicenantes bacterium]|nr:transcription antitermination factor NusB [Candidatus Aminicenantes bacterium]
MKKERRTAREIALKILYQMEMGSDPMEALREYLAENRTIRETREYAEYIIKGVSENLDEIDNAIKKSTKKNFSLLLPIEKTILRIAAFEILNGIKPAIAIDEAVELAKRYGEANSYRLINGILDSLHKENAS